MPFELGIEFVSQGRLTIAQRFIAGERLTNGMSPVGTDGPGTARFQSSLRDEHLALSGFPAIKSLGYVSPSLRDEETVPGVCSDGPHPLNDPQLRFPTIVEIASKWCKLRPSEQELAL